MKQHHSSMQMSAMLFLMSMRNDGPEKTRADKPHLDVVISVMK